ncbi:MAG: ribonuclease D [Ardenticatenaceae bacterium]|nr:ribonuclease D [Ardenticatenaceae bacterium]MCB9446333.1 ribonuclease D [Ardenticatenaceae bacterium]
MKLPPHQLITTPQAWQTCFAQLSAQPRLAIDLEANSMYAYRERVCLIQISIPQQDYILDPVADIDLSGLGQLIVDPAVEKVFHAAEYDLILLKRQYGWELNNLFDTMWAARILGYDRYGLASVLEDLYQIKLNKRYQKSNWCKRPLSPPQLTYAQHDTHFLLRLRDRLEKELQAVGRLEEAQEIFEEQTRVMPNNNHFDPDSFWSINGAYDLTPPQQAVLKALNIYRDEEARARNQPLFKVLHDKTLLLLAQETPQTFNQMQEIPGMTWGQIRRYGRGILDAIHDGLNSPPPDHPKRPKRPSDAVLNRYEKLHTWRKNRARKRGVESDVIISRHALWEIAEKKPTNQAELAQLDTLGAWRCQTYGQEILDLLSKSN